MPIYEYVCQDCGHEFELIQGWSDGSPTCSACGSERVNRRLSPPAIHFKGSGWYITDSKNGKNGKNGANGVSGSRGSAKSESKDVAASGDKEKPAASETKKESAEVKASD